MTVPFLLAGGEAMLYAAISVPRASRGSDAHVLLRLVRRGVRVLETLVLLRAALTRKRTPTRDSLARYLARLEHLASRGTAGPPSAFLLRPGGRFRDGTCSDTCPLRLEIESSRGGRLKNADRVLAALDEWEAGRESFPALLQVSRQQSSERTSKILLWSRNPASGGDSPVGYHLVSSPGRVLSCEPIDPSAFGPEGDLEEVVRWTQFAESEIAAIASITLVVHKGVAFLESVSPAESSVNALAKVLVEQVENGLILGPEALGKFPVDTGDVISNGGVVVGEPIARGVALGQRLIAGRACATQPALLALSSKSEPVILLRPELSTRDSILPKSVVGLVTSGCGITSHVAVANRGQGRAFITGVQIDLARASDGQSVRVSGATVLEGEWLTLDERTGEVYRGQVLQSPGQPFTAMTSLARWATDGRHLVVYGNADTSVEARECLAAGAAGVGLCRSERAIEKLGVEDFLWVALISDADATAADQIGKVLCALSQDLRDVLTELNGKPLHYRLLDLCPSEVLQVASRDLASLRRRTGLSISDLRAQIRRWTEPNPLLGLRGPRLGLRWRNLYDLQIASIADTVRDVVASGVPVNLCVLIPFVCHTSEAHATHSLIVRHASQQVQDEVVGMGCMLETPRGVALAPELAKYSSVLAFGTNDLTQFFWATARDSEWSTIAPSGATENPFTSLDELMLNSLILPAARSAIARRKGVRIFLCGEQASRASNLEKLGYVPELHGISCSSPRIQSISIAAGIVGARAASRQKTAPEARFHSSQEMAVPAAISLKEAGKDDKARETAFGWSARVAKQLSLPAGSNWKFFKRDLAARWFGPLEARRFLPGWDLEGALAYANSIRPLGRPVRYSVFPNSIACHAVSQVLPENENADGWRRRLDRLDRACAIEVFPQQSQSSVCFRVLLKKWEAVLESAIGQAMLVFEQEYGKHTIRRYRLDLGSLTFKPQGPGGAAMKPDRLVQGADALVQRHATSVFWRMADLQRTLALEWVGVEGYFAPESPESPAICDLDLPLDVAFH